MGLINFRSIAGLLSLLLVIAVVILLNLQQEEVVIEYLNVGQGDAIYFRTMDEYQVLIDGGPLSVIIEELGEVMPLYNKKIDLFVVTHPHADHFEGFIEVIERFDVEKVLLVGTPTNNPAYHVLMNKILENEIEVIYAIGKNDFKIGKYIVFDVVYPYLSMINKEVENKNNASVVIKVITNNGKYLFTGDAEHEEETEILKSGYELSADYMKAGHHGSKTATGEEFIKAVRPGKVVIQCGIDNRFNHPHVEALERMKKYGLEEEDILRNDLLGRINLTSFN